MRQISSFNNNWIFTKNEVKSLTSLPIGQEVKLPHTWNAFDGQDGNNDYHRGKCFYFKSFSKDSIPVGEEYYLEFKGVNSVAEVFVNGIKAGEHKGGYSLFRVNITPYLKKENILALSCDNSESTTVYPQMADFTFYGGIYRDVNIIAVDKVHFDLDYMGSPGISVTPVLTQNKAEIDFKVFSNKKEKDTILYEILDREDFVIDSKIENSEKVLFSLSSPHLWQGLDDPYLYKARATLFDKDEAVDRIECEFGIRSFEVSPEKGFILNGKEYPLRGVSRHQDRKDIGNALLKEHHEEDIDLICEMGASCLRLAHYQHDSYFYELCDKKGLIVWAEIPYISRHMPQGEENTLSQLEELIVQNYNHPSICFWGLSNEITLGNTNETLIENHRKLNDLAHNLDSTRYTTIACVSMCDIHHPYIQIPDLVAYNHYFGWYGGDVSMNGEWFDNFHKNFPLIPIAISEYGAEALNWHTSKPVQGDYTEEYQSFYHEEMIKQLFKRKYIWATFVWNMFDFGADARAEGGENGQNHKGLVTFDRKYKKDAFYAYKAHLSKEPFVHIASKRYVDRVEDITRVTIYSNLDEVELFANGISLGKKRAEDKFFRFDVANKGETTLEARAGNCFDKAIIRKVNTPNEDYILKEKGAVLNWFDISSPDGFLSLNSRVDLILKSEEGRAILEKLLGDIKNTSFEINENMMKMLEAFTLLRLTSLMSMAGKSFTKEELLALNEKLNKIKINN